MTTMELIFNEASLKRSQHIDEFKKKIKFLMAVRAEAKKRYDVELFCSPFITHIEVLKGQVLASVLKDLEKEQQLALRLWFGKNKHFWENRIHSEDDYIEYKNEVVTNTGLGESAFRVEGDRDCRVISLNNASWGEKLLDVLWMKSDDETTSIPVKNYETNSEIFKLIESDKVDEVSSWKDMISLCREKFTALNFTGDCFKELLSCPYSQSEMTQLLERFRVLQKLQVDIDANGEWSSIGKEVYHNFFTGDSAWFSDSSESEKHQFERQLTFSGKMYPWHGKVKGNNVIRLHFDWPMTPKVPLEVVYVGTKLTKK